MTMKRYVAIGLAIACTAILLAATQVTHASRPIEPKVRFAPVHIYLDSGDKPLAAYQFELKATTGTIKIVGIEGDSFRLREAMERQEKRGKKSTKARGDSHEKPE